jgi:septum formation protein
MSRLAVDRIVLASASPRRAELLEAAGIAFDVIPADVDETAHAGESPETYVHRVAHAKACAIGQRMPHRIVLAADTTVVVGSVMLGKPADEDEAKRMLRLLSGRVHEVLTAVALHRGSEGSPHVRLSRTDVEFAALSDEEIAWYVATGEPRDKAGAYAIQGYASRFVTRIAGSYSNVVGLPIALVCEMLEASGLRTP